MQDKSRESASAFAIGGACVAFYSRKVDPKSGRRRNLGTFKTRSAPEKHERAVQFVKHG